MTDNGGIHFKKHGIFMLALVLLFVTIFIFYLDWQTSHKKFTFAMLDVGQGDALFIESPSGVQILMDGGPPGRVLGKLARVLPFFDRSIDVLIITNPDQDHIGGFMEILKNYKVGMVLEPGTFNESKTYQNLKDEIERQNIPLYLAKQGMHLDLGSGAYMDILFPDRDVSIWSTNDGSIVARVVYGETSILLTGDSTIATENILLKENISKSLDVDILKVGHHGSHSSTSNEFVKMLSPSFALISTGKENKYGHPHKDVLETLDSFDIQILRTDLLGSIIMTSDGLNESFSFLK